MYQVTFIIHGSLFSFSTPNQTDAYMAYANLPNARVWKFVKKGIPTLAF